MNERTRELALQAGMTDDKFGMFFAKDKHDEDGVDLEKFAELMMKKFDDILLLQQLDCIGNHDKKSAELIEQIRDKTKTYFGVE